MMAIRAHTPSERSIPGGRRFVGRVEVPPSKSVTNRYLNLALLAARPVTIERPLVSGDTEAFAAALAELGFTVERRPGEWTITPPRRPVPAAEVHCGASGTMARFLTATLTARPGRWRLDGAPRLRERPLGPLIEALRGLGAEIVATGREGFLPLEIRGGTLGGGAVEVDAGVSSQFLSALLMAATRSAAAVRLSVGSLTSAPYVDLTLEAVEAWGGRVERLAAGGYRVEPGPLGSPRLRVPADDSSACYPAAAATLTGGEALLAGLARVSAHPDRRFLALLERMGARQVWTEAGELAVAGTGRLQAIEADLGEMPDQVPTLAALAPFAHGTTVVRNVAHLRLKESDRLAAMASGLERLGARATVTDDGLRIPGVWADRTPPSDPVTVDSHDDHRVAMSFAVLGLARPGVSIAEPRVVEKSYPAFWRQFAACTSETG